MTSNQSNKTQLDEEIEFLYSFGLAHKHMAFCISPKDRKMYLIDFSQLNSSIYLIKDMGEESYIYQVMKRKHKKIMKPKEILDAFKEIGVV